MKHQEPWSFGGAIDAQVLPGVFPQLGAAVLGVRWTVGLCGALRLHRIFCT